GEPWSDADDLMVCPNMRAAQIYVHSRRRAPLDRIVQALLKEPRVDQVIWTEAEDPQPGSLRFHVATADRGSLTFEPAGESDSDGTDQQGGLWRWRGELETLDATCGTDGRLHFGEYPNALERIAGGFEAESGQVWVTARPGTEFCLPRTTVHVGGGSHGALNTADSTVPLFVAGLPSGRSVPEHARTVDVTPICAEILEVHHPRRPGAAHRD
ncbi:MAG: hypothetical protein ACREIV_03005, partial [Planctomycetaceae bacterium]